jgi:nitroreductase
MRVRDAIFGRRSIRRFKQKPIPFSILKKLVDAGRMAPSAGNRQPVEFIVVDSKAKCKGVFATLKWASYIAPKGTPPQSRRPVSYIIVIVNKNKTPTTGAHDAAAAVQNILLLAMEYGIGSCWIGSIDRARLSKFLRLPQHCEIDSVVALGYPDEKPVVEKVKDSIKYWLDQKGVLHVPKRQLKDVLHRNCYGKI